MSNLSLSRFEPLLITAVNIAARAVHLVFFIAIGNKYGSTALTDNVIALLAPLVVLTSVTTGAADSVAMPVFHRAKNKDEASYIYSFFSKRIVVYISLLSLVICFASSLLYKNNYFLILILFSIPVFASLSALKAGVLNASNRFQVAVTGPLSGAAAAIFFLIMMPNHIYSFAASFLVFEVGKLVCLSFFKDISSGGISKKTNSSEKVIQWGYRNTKIQLLASFIMALIYPVDIWFAQSIKEVGAVTFVEYANKLWNIVPLLFTGHIAVTYASLSKTANVSNEALNNKKINIHSIALRYLLWGTITGIVIIFASDYLVRLLFGFGKITFQQQNVLSDLLKSYLVGSGFYIGGIVYVRALSAAGRIDILLTITIFSFICNIVGDFILIRISGLNGIGIATSVVYICSFFLLVFSYEKNKLAV